jgi:hypothetical protein
VTQGAVLRAGHNGERRHDVDRLRTVVIIWVFAVHLAEVFNPWDVWHITNRDTVTGLGLVALLGAPWLMPLMMLLAGTSAWYALRGRSNGAFVLDRVKRVLVPLVLGTLVLVPPQIWAERVWRGQYTGSVWSFYPHFFDGGLYPRGNLSWHHLWFLAHLFLYALLALPLFRAWQTDEGRQRVRRLARRCASPAGILVLALPMVLERHALWVLFPERHILSSDWANHAILFVAYLYGFLLAASSPLSTVLARQWRWSAFTALVGTSGIVALAESGVVPYNLPAPYSFGFLGFWTLYAVVAWTWMAAWLGYAAQHWHRPSAISEWGRRNGLVWYLVHQPVIVLAASRIVLWDAGPWPKFLALTAVSVAGTWVISEAALMVPPLRAWLAPGR